MKAAWFLLALAALAPSTGQAQGQRVLLEWRDTTRGRANFEVHDFRYSADAFTQTKPAIELLMPSGNVMVPYAKIASIEFTGCAGRGASHDQAARWDVSVHLLSGTTRSGGVDLRYLLGTDEDGLEWRLWMGHPCTKDARALRRLVFSP